MDLFTRSHLQLLLAPHEAPCVSLYMPTHRRRPESDQDPIRFKNLLKTAEGLLSKESSATEIHRLLEPVTDLADSWFWRHQRDGLALFRSGDLLQHFLLPMRLPELAVVAETFHVKPLLRFLQANQRFHVLALSQGEARLYEGNPFSLSQVALDGLPGTPGGPRPGERRESFLNLRTVGSASKAAIYHGHGNPDASRKDDLRRQFRAVDRALWEALREESSPLVLAGVGYYLPLYSEVSRLPNLLESGVEGNFEDAAPEEIHARVWPLIREHFRRREDESIGEYRAAVSRGLASDNLSMTARMTVQGRVRRLLLAEGAHVWGRLDRESGRIDPASSQQGPQDDDILDDLAEGVLVRGGEVLVLPPERLPVPGPVAAVLRW
jgi:hypothetical protein